MKENTKQIVIFIVLFVFLAGSFFAARLRLYPESLKLEEGIFAELIVHHSVGPKYCMIGRIDGEKIYVLSGHPAGLYELLRFGGKLVSDRFLKPVYQNDALITPRLRIFCSLYQLFFWVFLLIAVFRFKFVHRVGAIMLLFVAMLSPLAIKVSTDLQTDNTAGVVFCGAGALLFVLAVLGTRQKTIQTLLLLGGGILAGLGKQEWSFALLPAIFLTGLYLFIRKGKIGPVSPVPLYFITAGLLVGNLASYLLDPENYLEGIFFMLKLSNMTSLSQTSWSFSRWLDIMSFRLPFLPILLILILLIVCSILKEKSMPDPVLCVTALFGCFLFVGYILSEHSAKLRYFAPSLTVLTVAAIALLPAPMPGWYRRVFAGCLAVVLLTTAVFLYGCGPDRNESLEWIQSGQYQPQDSVVLHIDDAAVWNKPAFDYIIKNLNYENSKQILSARYGKTLVSREELAGIKSGDSPESSGLDFIPLELTQ